MSRTDSLRFRQSGATLVAALIAFVSALPLAGSRWALTPLLLLPVGFGVWAWRAGTDVDAAGLRVRALLGTTAIAWDRVAGLTADPRGRASALLTDGHEIRLTGVSAADLPAVVAAAGGHIDTPDPASPEPAITDADTVPGSSDGAGSVPVDDAVDQRLPRDEPA